MIRDKYLEKIAKKCNLSYKELLKYTQTHDFVGSNNLFLRYVFCFQSETQWSIFWKRYERITGKKMEYTMNEYITKKKTRL